MKRALILSVVLMLAPQVSQARADDFEDTFLIDLNDLQISPDVLGQKWSVEGLSASGDLLFPGDSYTARIRFLNNEGLLMIELGYLHFLTRSVSGQAYSLDFNFSISGPSDARSWVGSTDSDISGIAGGTFSLPAVVPSILIDAIDVRWDLVSGAAMFDTIDIGLIGEGAAIVPEPASVTLLLGWMFIGGLLARRPRR